MHKYLRRLFGEESVCPARVNEQLIFLSLSEIRKYRVFSGHLDWSLLDCIAEPRFIFTILREPVDRILSFYFYLRETAKTLPQEELKQPWNTGMRMALTLSSDEYFAPTDPGFRTFINNHYDNFYTYYFAGRTFDARQKIVTNQKRANRTDDDIREMAIANLATLSAVYGLHQLNTLGGDLLSISGSRSEVLLADIRVNEGVKVPRSRMQTLRELGASQITFDQIERMTRLDQKIWRRFCST